MIGQFSKAEVGPRAYRAGWIIIGVYAVGMLAAGLLAKLNPVLGVAVCFIMILWICVGLFIYMMLIHRPVGYQDRPSLRS
jgi:hypothetical protein